MSNTSNNTTQYCYRYPHAAITADCVIFGFDGTSLKILLVERGIEPYKGMWALPGGFMKIDETIEQTAKRELQEETGLTNVYLDQFKVFSDVNRDPRERVVTVAFIALVRPHDYQIIAGDDAVNALWFDDRSLPPMAFDHVMIINAAREHLSEALRIKPVAFQLLNRQFSMSELQHVYEAITGQTYDRRNFMRKAMQSGILEEISAPCDDDSPVLSDCAINTDSAEPIQPDSNSSRPSSPRSRKKLFSFKPFKTHSDDEDGSTKDIFNF